MAFTTKTKIADVINDPSFSNFGHLIFPTRGYFSGTTLGDLSLTWYSHIDPNKTVEILNYMKSQVETNHTIFYDIYNEQQKQSDPAKKNTGLFFFRGKAGSRFSICNAGGGFAYVGAMHDSFPHCLELSKKGYNSFALIYRPNSNLACVDLSYAIKFVFEHAKELQIDVSCYSLWGGSAGARMAAYLGSYGTSEFCDFTFPRPGAVIMQYTGHSDITENDPPTYNCVGTNDWIASWKTMKCRIENLKKLGIDAEFHKYEGLGHGFGLGKGTVADGWINDAVEFWERQMK